MKRILLVLVIVGMFLTACTSSQLTSDQKPKEQEIYVFDDANVKNSKDTAKAVVEKTVNENVTKQVIEEKKEIPVLKEMNFIVQLGAYSSKDKAEKFVSENKSKLNYELKILYSEAVKLFVVQLPPYNSKEDAEKVRNKLWETAVFKDAFIVTSERK